jgi:peptidoglycan/LPS O-acetylase OafA/YrhL
MRAATCKKMTNSHDTDFSTLKVHLLPDSLWNGLNSDTLPGLNGIRAIAVFLVIFYHFGIPLVSGGLGVLIFFVLSGFLITWLLLIEQERTNSVSIKNFYIRRTLRIFPAFYIYWLVIITYLLMKHRSIGWWQAVCSLLYVNNYYQALLGDPNTAFSHTWSLAVEEQFYLCWPFVFVKLSQNRRRMVHILVAVIGLLWVYRITSRFVFGVWQGYVYEAFEMRSDHLLIGCLLALSLRLGLWSRFWKFVCASSVPGALIIIGLVLCSFGDALVGVTFRDSVGFIVEPVLSAVLIACAVSGQGIWKLLDHRWMSFLGKLSYSIYLYQQLTIGFAKGLTAGQPVLIRLTFSVGLTVLVALGSHFFVERYFILLKRRYFGTPPSMGLIKAQ